MTKRNDENLGKANVSALTKAKMADQLFDELGLNKREAKEIVELFFAEVSKSLEQNIRLSCPGLVISTCEKKVKDRGVILRPVKKYPLPPGAW